MRYKQIVSRLITVLVILTQVLAGVSGVLPAQAALAAAPTPRLAQVAKSSEAVAAPAPALAVQAKTASATDRATGVAGPELARPSSPEGSVAAPAAKPLAAGGPASISGLVYSDFNANGAKETNEVNVGGVTVTAYDASGVALASTTASTATATLGQYTLSGLPANTPVRLEFTTLPVAYQSAPHGSTNSIAVQFVTTTSGALSNVNFGVNNPADYSQSNPDMATSLYVNGDANTAAPTGTLVKFPYDSTFGSAAPTTLATKAQIGSTWGLAYARTAKTLYAAAFLKRHVGIGPNGPGAIYAININSGAATLFANLATLGANVGTVLSNSARGLGSPLMPSNDPTAFDQVGKVGLGDIDLSDDEQMLYAVSLNDKKLYALNAPAGTLAGSYAIPDPGCTGGAWRPFALKFKQGVLYVGGVCDAQAAQDRANLKAYIYRFTPGANTFSQVLSFPLNYVKGPATGPCCQLAFSGWYPWLSTFDTTKINLSIQDGIVAVYPQPIFSDIEFDVDGSLILGFSDRFGHQTGDRNYGTTGTTGYDGLVGGDILRACPNAAGNWVLESGGACGGVTGGGANGQGPGGGEFYFGEYFYSSSSETSMGGLALKPGSGYAALTVMDPYGYITGGVSWLNNKTGNADRRYTVYPSTRGVYFGKANGLGDLELLADPAPIEIGNRVWLDTNANGIQDPGEPSLANVGVALYDSNNNYLATVATDARGEYYFSNADGVDTANAKYNLAGLKFNTSGYQLRIDTTQPPLRGLGLTTADADSSANGDARDSDGQMSGNNAAITFTTGAAGANNHTYDFGFKFTGVRIGNRVWKDNNGDGLQDPKDTSIAGITVGLYQTNGNPVLCAQGQTGYYLDTGAGATDSAGTLNWAGQPWTFAGAGVVTGGNPGNTVYVYGNGTATRAVDLSAFDGYPVLSYDFAYHYTTNAYTHTVEYSTNSGVTWQTLATYTDNSSSTTWQHVAYVLPTLSANARIRIRGLSGGTFNYLGIDNLRIEGLVATPVTTVTDANGLYWFDSTTCVLPSSQYQVRLATAQTPLVGLSLTTLNAGGVTSNDPTGDDSDSDASTTTISNTVYASILATSPATGVNPSYDFGFVPLEIGNYVWKDLNADGLQDSGEPGIPGVTVGLYANSGNQVQCTQVGRYDTYRDEFSTTGNTNSNGTLDWSSKAWVQTNTSLLTTNGNPGGSLRVNSSTVGYYATRAVDLSVFATQPTLSFDYNMAGVAGKFNILYSNNGGTSFTTLATLTDNNNGYKTITYTLPITVANAQIRIQGFGLSGGNWAYFDNLTIQGQVRYPVTTVTDSKGEYYFTAAQCVQPNTQYQVRIDTTQVPSNPLYGLFLTTQNAGGVTSNDPTGDDSDSDASTVQINGTPNAVINALSPTKGVNYSYDFGFTAVEIGNYVWKDTNADGLQTSGEPGIPGVTVGLYDNSGNAVMCPQSSTANLALNKTATQVSDFGASYLAANAVDGDTATGASITGSSANSWWQVDLGQSALVRQVVVYARPDGVGHAQTEQIYVLVSNQPFASTTLATTLADANVWHSALIGVWTGASLTVSVPNYLGRYVRIQHSNTSNLSLGEVQVYGDPASLVTDVTDANGLYTFTGANCVQPNTAYQVRLDMTQAPLASLFLTTQNAGGVTSNDPTGDDSDSDASKVTLSGKPTAVINATSPATGANYSYDFGFIAAEIGNYVWKDTNADGLQDSGEPGIPGVTVGLYDASGNQMQCTQVGRYDTYLDQFTTTATTNSNGTLSWSSKAWVLASASLLTTNGNPGGALQVNGGSATSVATRPVDLSVFATQPTLSFDYNMAGTASKFNILYSNNGGTSFTTLATLSDNNNGYKSITYTLPITVANAQIRIAGFGTGGGATAYFDNLTIQGQVRYPVTTVTDSNGEYYFTGANCIQPSTTYQVRIATEQTPLVNLHLTTSNAGGVTSNDPTGDDSDSDASLATINSIVYARISNAPAPAAGVNYSYDFGFTPDVGTIVIRKTTNPAGSSERFSLTSNVPGYSSFMLADGGSYTLTAVPVGTYAVTETVPAGWTQATSTCTNSSTLGAIQVSKDTTTTCNLLNVVQPTNSNVLTVTKSVNWNGNTPEAGRTFKITISGPAFPGDKVDTITAGQTKVYTNVVAGVYTVTETSPGAGWVTTYSVPSGVVNLSATVPTATTAGPLSGNVFRDYNADGVDAGTGEPGVTGVTVTAYDPNGVARGSATTDANGNYSFTPTGSGPYRLELTNLPAGVYPTKHGTITQFVTTNGGASNLNFGVNLPADYCQNNPTLCTSVLINGDPLAGGTANWPGALVAVPEAGGNITTTLANGAKVGATWGQAWQASTRKLYSAAVVRRHAGFGPAGLGGIYVTHLAGTPSTNTLVDLQNAPFNLSVGTLPGNAQRGLQAAASTTTTDTLAFAAVGKQGLGDLDLSEDGNTLWAVNLNNRSLVKLNVTNGVTPTAAQEFFLSNMGAPTCTGGVLRPWGLKFHAGKGFVGAVCTAETSGLASDMNAYVLSFDPAAPTTLTTVLNFSLTYTKGAAFSPFSPNSNKWYPWTDTYADALMDGGVAYATSSVQGAHPTPILADIEFDASGAMILGFVDRFAMQIGSFNLRPNGGAGTIAAVSGGDILRACPDVAGNFVLESGGACGGVTGGGANSQGPGNGEFYSGEGVVIGGTAHQETSNGALAQLPGGNRVALSVIDPTGNSGTGGVRWLSNTTGAVVQSSQLFANEQPATMGKAVGTGDIEYLCDSAPVEIGSRVWKDLNSNGVQDPGEPGIASVTVALQSPTNTVTTNTDANGLYYFDVNPNTAYTITINPSQAALSGLSLTQANLQAISGNPSSNDPLLDTRDSDAVTIGGKATIYYTTGSAGQSNHGLDFGWAPKLTGKVTINNKALHMDWGDNPDQYATTVTNTGAVHLIVPGLRLGATEDTEVDGEPNNTATGDGPDEDGVQFPTLTAGSTAVLTVTATNTGSTPAIIYGWIDFNGNGQLEDSERVTATVSGGTTNGVFFLTYNVPVAAVRATYTRFRFSTDPAAAQPTGFAFDGEVEDYPVAIQAQPSVQFGDRVWIESDADGLASTGVITPVAGMVITATAGTNTYTATTDSQGYYSFIVAPGLYTVRYGSVPAAYGVVLPSATPGGSAVQGNAGSYQETGNPDTSHPNATTVDLADGEANWQVDFAFHTPHADLRLVKQVNKRVAKTGDTLVYTLVLTNVGPDTATNVKVNDLLPATVLYQSATAQQGSYAANTGVWTVGTLAVNSSATLTITVQSK